MQSYNNYVKGMQDKQFISHYSLSINLLSINEFRINVYYNKFPSLANINFNLQTSDISFLSYTFAPFSIN